MKTNNLSFFVFYILITSLFVGSFVFKVQSQTQTTLTFSPSTYLATSLDETFTLDLKITDVSNLRGWTTDVTWNSEVLELVGKPVEGNFLSSIDSTVFITDVSNSNGSLNVASTIIMSESASGSGTLATLTFKIIASATHSPVNLVNTSLISPEPGHFSGSYEEIAHTAPQPSATVSLMTGEGPLAHPGDSQTVDEGNLVTFDASQTTPITDDTTFLWTFEDDGNQTLDGIAPTYTFDVPGVYEVFLTVTDGQSLISEASVLITVTDITPPVAKIILIEGSSTRIEVGSTVNFEAIESYDPEDGVLKTDGYLWDLGDGSVHSDEKLSDRFFRHVYEKTGTYTVSLTVTDQVGLTDSTTIQVTVVDKQKSASSLNLPIEVTWILVGITIVVIAGSVFWLTGTELTKPSLKTQKKDEN